MTAAGITEFIIRDLASTNVTENFGYQFFFYGDEKMLPFATLAQSDNEYDRVSNLDREGVFRLNIGVGKERFRALCGEAGAECDYTRLNVFMPHPDYAAQHFLCVLNPEGDVLETTLDCLREAHALAKARYERKNPPTT